MSEFVGLGIEKVAVLPETVPITLPYLSVKLQSWEVQKVFNPLVLLEHVTEVKDWFVISISTESQ